MHHRAKQAPGWHLTQPKPGHMTWRTTQRPRVYETTGDPYQPRNRANTGVSRAGRAPASACPARRHARRRVRPPRRRGALANRRATGGVLAIGMDITDILRFDAEAIDQLVGKAESVTMARGQSPPSAMEHRRSMAQKAGPYL